MRVSGVLADLDADGDVGAAVLLRMDRDGNLVEVDVVTGPADLLDRTRGHHLGGNAFVLQRKIALQELVLGNSEPQGHQPAGGVERPEHAPVGMALDVLEQQRRAADVRALADARGDLEACVHLPLHRDQLVLALQHVKEFSQVLMQGQSPGYRSSPSFPRCLSPTTIRGRKSRGGRGPTAVIPRPYPVWFPAFAGMTDSRWRYLLRTHGGYAEVTNNKRLQGSLLV